MFTFSNTSCIVVDDDDNIIQSVLLQFFPKYIGYTEGKKIFAIIYNKNNAHAAKSIVTPAGMWALDEGVVSLPVVDPISTGTNGSGDCSGDDSTTGGDGLATSGGDGLATTGGDGLATTGGDGLATTGGDGLATTGGDVGVVVGVVVGGGLTLSDGMQAPYG